MKKLKIAILWHQHQPYYRMDDEFILPWVRFHAVKDYLDLPLLLHEYPDVKQTFNLAPSLMLQIEEYLSSKASDKIQKLSRINSKDLTENDKDEILKSFFIINHQNLLYPFDRYRELLEFSRMGINGLSNQDYLDLQVWYNLAWIGQISKNDKFIQRLFKKARGFTEKEKLILLDKHDSIMSALVNELKILKQLGQIDISCSPMYHPILPLLCNTNSAKEAMPGLFDLPEFKFPQDAENQINLGLEYYHKLFDIYPNGMWPSEGSVSNESLNAIEKSGIKWVATDELVLKNSNVENWNEYSKYFPHKYICETNDMTMFFRDHHLSDKIGFVYSNWNEKDAVNDFFNELKNIKESLVSKFGFDVLDHALVPIILDGENCWEFYKDNGIHFLREFFARFQNNDDFETVLFSELNANSDYSLKINDIRAGSWINSNFSIWIGDKEDQLAWKFLADARNCIEKYRDKLSDEQYSEIMNLIYIAEGSDWFWWYGPEHDAPNKPDFDIMFRKIIKSIYIKIGIDYPAELDMSIAKQLESIHSQFDNAPDCDGKLESSYQWKSANALKLNSEMSTMHQIGEIIDKAIIMENESYYYLRFYLIDTLNENKKILLDVNGNNIEIYKDRFLFNNALPVIKSIVFDETLDLVLIKENAKPLEINLETHNGDLNIKYRLS